MLETILNLYPKKSWPNFGIGSVALILAIACIGPYGAWGWKVLGVALLAVSAFAWVRYVKQNAKGL